MRSLETLVLFSALLSGCCVSGDNYIHHQPVCSKSKHQNQAMAWHGMRQTQNPAQPERPSWQAGSQAHLWLPSPKERLPSFPAPRKGATAPPSTEGLYFGEAAATWGPFLPHPAAWSLKPRSARPSRPNALGAPLSPVRLHPLTS